MTGFNFALTVPDNQQAPRWESSNAWPTFMEFEYTLLAPLTNGDTIDVPANSLPATGIRIAEIELITPQLDTNATPTGTISAGDTVNGPTIFIDNANMGAGQAGYQVINTINRPQSLAGNGVVNAGINFLYSASDTNYGVGTNGPIIRVQCTESPATGATGTVRLKVWYWCTGEE